MAHKYLVSGILGKHEVFDDKEEAIKLALKKAKRNKHSWTVREMPAEEYESFKRYCSYHPSTCPVIWNSKTDL